MTFKEGNIPWNKGKKLGSKKKRRFGICPVCEEMKVKKGRIYCSFECYWKSLKGRKLSYSSWNKGLTKETDLRVAGQAEKLKGCPGPNLGKRGPETSQWGKKRPEHSELMKEHNPLHDPEKGKERREKLSESCVEKWKDPEYKKKYLGSNNPAWQGGKSFEPYGREFNDELKEEIRNRDKRVCQFCGRSEFEVFKAYRDKLNVHHIDYEKTNNNPTNLISLCRGCHSKTGSDREFWQKYFTEMMIQRYQEDNLQVNQAI